MNTYTFIFEISYKDPSTGKFREHEYRKKPRLTIKDARLIARRLWHMPNVIEVKFYKEMI